jgi:thiamine biosynthesis lipoprotein
MAVHRFHAMGTEVEVHLQPAPGDLSAAFAEVEALFERLEQMFSRFRPDSNLSVLNREGAAEVCEEFLDLVAFALEARERTDGSVDPTVHEAVVAAGYDRSFEQLRADRPGPIRAIPAGGDVKVRGRRVQLGVGVRLDLGGFAKGYAVDRAVQLLSPLGACLVNAGGDLAVGGVPAEGVWPVSVALPDGPLTVGLRRGALVTSGCDRRRWSVAGREQHHLIDPKTGRPADTNLERVSAAAPTALQAEVLAKWLFLAGEERAVAAAEARALPCVLVTGDGRVRLAGGLR